MQMCQVKQGGSYLNDKVAQDDKKIGLTELFAHDKTYVISSRKSTVLILIHNQHDILLMPALL